MKLIGSFLESFISLLLVGTCLTTTIFAETQNSGVVGIDGAVKSELVSVDTLQAFSDAWNAHDLDKLMTFMADEDCEFHTAAGPGLLGTSFIGQEEVRHGFSQAFINFPDAQWLNPVHFVAESTTDGSVRAVTESTFVGTKTGPDNNQLRVEARMVDVFTFNAQGKIQVKNAFRKDRPAKPL